jgi:hypothetical protein
MAALPPAVNQPGGGGGGGGAFTFYPPKVTEQPEGLFHRPGARMLLAAAPSVPPP